MGSKFAAGFLLLLLVLGATLKMKLFFGWSPDLVIALLVAYGMLYGFYETLIFAGFAVWVLNWQPFPGPELGIIFILAMISFLGRFFMPWQRWVSVALLTAGGILLMYAASAPGAMAANWRLLLMNAMLSVIFTFAVIRIFRFFYPRLQ